MLHFTGMLIRFDRCARNTPLPYSGTGPLLHTRFDSAPLLGSHFGFLASLLRGIAREVQQAFDQMQNRRNRSPMLLDSRAISFLQGNSIAAPVEDRNAQATWHL
jgi:hypothetical protein